MRDLGERTGTRLPLTKLTRAIASYMQIDHVYRFYSARRVHNILPLI